MHCKRLHHKFRSPFQRGRVERAEVTHLGASGPVSFPLDASSGRWRSRRPGHLVAVGLQPVALVQAIASAFILLGDG
jgi:hypothetical protein